MSNNSTSFQTSSIAQRRRKYRTAETLPSYESRTVCSRTWPTSKSLQFSRTSISKPTEQLRVAVILLNSFSAVSSNRTITEDLCLIRRDSQEEFKLRGPSFARTWPTLRTTCSRLTFRDRRTSRRKTTSTQSLRTNRVS